MATKKQLEEKIHKLESDIRQIAYGNTELLYSYFITFSLQDKVENIVWGKCKNK